jgi:hypothetical protein
LDYNWYFEIYCGISVFISIIKIEIGGDQANQRPCQSSLGKLRSLSTSGIPMGIVIAITWLIVEKLPSSNNRNVIILKQT